MFYVESRFQYIHHCVSSREIADAVREDLSSRKDCANPELVIVEETSNNAKWDPGGPIWIGDEKHIFKLQNINIEVCFQHINYLKSFVISAKNKLREWNGVKYHKIHSGYMWCVCVSPNELDELIEQLEDQELLFKASASLDEVEERKSSAGIVQVRAVKDDDDGKERLVEVKRKEQVLN